MNGIMCIIFGARSCCERSLTGRNARNQRRKQWRVGECRNVHTSGIRTKSITIICANAKRAAASTCRRTVPRSTPTPPRHPPPFCFSSRPSGPVPVSIRKAPPNACCLLTTAAGSRSGCGQPTCCAACAAEPPLGSHPGSGQHPDSKPGWAVFP